MKNPDVKLIQSWLVSYLALALEVEESKISVTTPIEEYGLDSRTALGMIAELEDEFNCEIDPSLIYESPTIESLAFLVHSSLS
jgi:acyl carrier protein